MLLNTCFGHLMDSYLVKIRFYHFLGVKNDIQMPKIAQSGPNKVRWSNILYGPNYVHYPMSYCFSVCKGQEDLCEFENFSFSHKKIHRVSAEFPPSFHLDSTEILWDQCIAMQAFLRSEVNGSINQNILVLNLEKTNCVPVTMHH